MRPPGIWTLSLALVLACAPARAAGDPAKERMDFADGLYARDMYDMALSEYDAVASAYPAYAGVSTACYRAAESLFFLKRYDEAIKRYQDFIARFAAAKEAPVADARIGESLYLAGRRDEALAHFALLVQSPSDTARQMARYYSGKILYEKGSADAAEEHFREVSAPDGNESQFRPFSDYYLGEILLAKSRADDAERFFRRAAASGKAEIADAANFGLGKSLFVLNRFEDADAAFAAVYRSGRASPLAEDAFLNGLNSLYNQGRSAELAARAASSEAAAVRAPEKIKAMRFLVADSHVKAKEYDEAFRLYDAIALQGDAADRSAVELKKINALVEKDDLPGALARLDALTDFDPSKRDELHFAAANIYTRMKKPAEAVGELKKLLAEAPNSPRAAEAALNEGYLYLDMGQAQKARRALRGFLEQFPGHPQSEKALYDLILIDVKLGSKYETISHAKEFLDKHPKSPKAPKVLLRLASSYTDVRDFDAAEETYQKFLAKYPAAPETAEALFAAGCNEQAAGRHDKAIAYYDRVGGAGAPRAVQYSTLKNRAYCYVSLKRPDDAARDYDEIISLYSDTDFGPEGYFWLANHYAEKNEPAKLEAVLAKFKARPDAAAHEAEVGFYEGESMRLLGLYAEAIAKYDASIARNGVLLADAHFGKGQSLAASGSTDAARTEFEEVLRLAADDQRLSIKARLQLAGFLYAAGKYEEAAKANLAVGILYDDSDLIPQALLNAAEAFEKAGQPDHAQQVYKEITQRFQGHPLAVRAAAKLKPPAGTR